MSHKISYRENGEGDPLILVHGYGGSVLHWDPLVKILKNHFRIIVPNFSHLYMSQDRLLFSIQIEKFADFIREKFPNEKVRIAGTSYGGALTWGLSLRYPELISEMILINPMVTHPIANFLPSELRYVFMLPLKAKYIYFLLGTPLGKTFLLKVAELFRSERSHGQGKIDQLEGRKLQFISHVISHFSWILRNEDWNYWDDKLSEISTRTCLIYDKNDSLFNEETYLNFSEKIVCDSVITTTGMGHLSIKMDPDNISNLILHFLAASSRAPLIQFDKTGTE